MIDAAARIAPETLEEDVPKNGRAARATIAKPLPPPPTRFREGHEPVISKDLLISRRRPFLAILFRLVRHLRAKRESAAIRQAQRDAGQFKAQALVIERNAEARIQKVERERQLLSQRIKELQDALDDKDTEIAKRDREIDVLQKNVDHLESLHESELSRRKAEISVNNRVIAEAELGERRTVRTAMEQA